MDYIGQPQKNKGQNHSNNNALLGTEPSYKRARAALTAYIINKRRMAMESLERMRDKSIPTPIPCQYS